MDRLPNGLTPEQDAALDRLAEAIADHITSPCDMPSCAIHRPPTDSEIDAAIEAATANLTTRGTK